MNERAEFIFIASLMALPLLATGCNREAENKVAEFKVVADSVASTTDELCAASEAAASAWLTRQNPVRYSYWKAEAEHYCSLKDRGIMFPPRGA